MQHAASSFARIFVLFLWGSQGRYKREEKWCYNAKKGDSRRSKSQSKNHIAPIEGIETAGCWSRLRSAGCVRITLPRIKIVQKHRAHPPRLEFLNLERGQIYSSQQIASFFP